MPFRRFFDRGAKDAARANPAAESAEVADETSPPDEESVEEGEAETAEAIEHDDVDWATRARAVLPTGASTGSKRTEALYGAADASGPTHFAQAVGCHVTDVDGNEYLDCTMGLGSVALGYAEPNVIRAVVDAIAAGSVSALSSYREVDVAERLCGVIPCADRVQFLKTGAEAMAAAVRLARTYTARDLVIGCGYFGWLDWCADEALGVPEETRATFRRVPFDDIAALDQAVSDAGAQLAAIVIEPVIERLPSLDWIKRARERATASGAVLVFDEIKTGFRLRTGGYQAYAEVVPDLAAFGKAMANGFPLAAVVGDRDVMEAARKTWISSTLASEASALAAAQAVLSWHDQVDVCESLWTIGADMRRAVSAAVEASGVEGITVDGIDPMWMLRFDRPEREQRFLEHAAANGVLLKRGAYNFAALAHDEDALRDLERAASGALVELRDEEAQT
ncbi:MAG TPA: aminotransferase class III-fold pyridoxal phosphate-dependent enzyme [Gemmatimonadaceae bacterium]|jgi:glutamate-1-semialdehyde aminotransferase|nr:aminotransferase class III-fold pyridoxal phosphate-dependent enzyme [Gemmatimonadaceae bacterium]